MRLQNFVQAFIAVTLVIFLGCAKADPIAVSTPEKACGIKNTGTIHNYGRLNIGHTYLEIPLDVKTSEGRTVRSGDLIYYVKHAVHKERSSYNSSEKIKVTTGSSFIETSANIDPARHYSIVAVLDGNDGRQYNLIALSGRLVVPVNESGFMCPIRVVDLDRAVTYDADVSNQTKPLRYSSDTNNHAPYVFSTVSITLGEITAATITLEVTRFSPNRPVVKKSHTFDLFSGKAEIRNLLAMSFTKVNDGIKINSLRYYLDGPKARFRKGSIPDYVGPI